MKLFRLWLGVTEYLFRNPKLLDEALDTAIDDKTFRSDDLEFTFAARVITQTPWSSNGSDAVGHEAFHSVFKNPW